MGRRSRERAARPGSDVGPEAGVTHGELSQVATTTEGTSVLGSTKRKFLSMPRAQVPLPSRSASDMHAGGARWSSAFREPHPSNTRVDNSRRAGGTV